MWISSLLSQVAGSKSTSKGGVRFQQAGEGLFTLAETAYI